MRKFLPVVVFLAALLLGAAGVAGAAGQGFTIFNAIQQAVTTNPGVGEAAANRRATEAELRQNQGTLLPQVRLEARTGRVRWNFKDQIQPPAGNNLNLWGREKSIVVRQTIFDGFASINEIWRQAARVDAAAYRTRERTELIALDAAEAYIDVVRYKRLIALADENVAAHRALLANVNARFQGGRAGEGDLQQVRERVEAAVAAQAQFREQYDEARGTFRRAIGIEPFNLRGFGRLGGLPSSKDQALAVTLRSNPTIAAAQADRDAAKHAFDATAGAFVPNVAFEGRWLWGTNTATVFGDRTDYSAMVVASWDIFRGGQDAWKRVEASEQYQQTSMAHARLQRGAYESIDKAWSARTITADRIAALIRQIDADRKVIVAYQKEYELGQRSLIDLLNAQNQLFNAGVSLESSRGVAAFADFQLLAAMGELLNYLKSPMPIDARPLETRPLGLLPTKLPPILFGVPPGSAPLDISKKHSGALEPGVIKAIEPPFGFATLWPTATRTANADAKASPTGSAQQWLALESKAKPTEQTAGPVEREFPVSSFAPSYTDVSNWPFKR
ncbi:MAG TPA: TolC family outer membrane protein [Pirellulales bacterium]|jgi:adhesin transport system outer membrane protein|nr:TolC family outer membrane protein [Pirellulales bacterium]